MQQSFDSHTRFLPPFHFVVSPLLLLNLVLNVRDLIRTPNEWTLWGTILAFALMLGIFLSRLQVLTVQDRVIRLEETLRLQRLLPASEHGEIAQLSRRDFVALRFASDEELPALFRRVRKGEFADAKAIKRAITNWRADHLRA